MNGRPYTDIELKIIRAKYPDHTAASIARELNRAQSSIHTAAHKLRVKKSKAFNNSINSGRLIKGHAERGINTRYKPGHVPWSKGRKIGSHGRSKQTQFKKGQLPYNTLEDGVVTIRRDKTGKKYKWIRISMGKWAMLHRHTWIKLYGPVPDDKIVAFKNGDAMDCRPENLMLITRTENMVRNQIHKYPESIKQSIRALNKLKKAIHEKQD